MCCCVVAQRVNGSVVMVPLPTSPMTVNGTTLASVYELYAVAFYYPNPQNPDDDPYNQYSPGWLVFSDSQGAKVSWRLQYTVQATIVCSN